MNLNQKYRPKTFEEVCGQSVTTTILKQVIKSKSFKNCYLFAGKTGSGKTTVARLFARAVNNGQGDPIELDCASNGSVDSIRAIVESANQRAIDGEYKVFILDECHAISGAGWQAFLKCIEEPPKYTIFIFCTTTPQKVPDTILNRVQRYNFAPIASSEIKNRLIYICKQEGFTNYEQTCDFISKLCDGSARDAITSLEQVADYSTDVNIENAKKVLGELSYETMFKLTWAITGKKEADVLTIIETLSSEGRDLRQFVSMYLDFILDLLKYKLFSSLEITSIPSYLATPENAVVQFTTKDCSTEYLSKLSDKLLAIKAAIKEDTSYKTTAEIMLLNFMRTTL